MSPSVLRAQSIEEISFTIMLRGLTKKSHAMVMVGDDLVARYTCVDSGGTEHTLYFEPVDRSILDQPSTRPSALLDAGQWLKVSDSFASRPKATELDLRYAIAALQETLLFVGDPRTEPFVSAEGAAYRDTQPPGTFDRPRLLARLEVYERMLAPSPVATRRLLPILKAPDFAHRDLCVHMTLPGLPQRADLPIVAFAENTPNGYVLLTKQDAPNANPVAMLAETVDRLTTDIPRDLAVVRGEIAVHGGKDLAAELLVSESFLRSAVAPTLHSHEFWVCVPHREAFYALKAGAQKGNVEAFVAMVTADRGRASTLGHALVSDQAFYIRDGKIVDAVVLRTLIGARSRSVGDWLLAALLAAFFGGVIGMGIGIGIISAANVDPELSGIVVLGCASMLAVGAFLLAFRFAGRK